MEHERMDRNEEPTRGCRVRPLAIAAAFVFWLVGGAAHAQSSPTSTDGTGASVQAQVVTPARRPLTRQLRLPGSLIADVQADLYAKTSGFVMAVNVEIGDRVSAGQVLLTLDVPEMTEEIRQAEAVVAERQATVRAFEAKAREGMRTVETARAEVQRFAAQRKLDELNLSRREELFAANAVPQQALDEAVIALAVSDAQHRIAEAKTAGAIALQASVEADTDVARAQALVATADHARRLALANYTILVAPFDGVITMRNVDPGSFVRSGEGNAPLPALQMMDTRRLRAVMEVAEVDAPFVRAGTPVNIDVTSLGRLGVAAAVTRTAGAIRPDTRTMRVEVDLANDDGLLTPGMYVEMTLTLESKTEVTMIPSKSIRTAAAGTVVFVVEQGVAKSAPITVGYDDGIWAEVLSGLTGSEQVITATSGAIIVGSRVLAIPSGS